MKKNKVKTKNSKLKIAYCLVGLVGYTERHGGGQPLDFHIAHKNNKRNIFGDNDVDVFVHSWSVDFEDEIVKLYKPKEHIFEEQIEFDDDARMNAVESRWYSTKKCVELMKNYESDNNIKYDFVMIYRFDSAFLTKLDFDELKKYNKKNEQEFVYGTHSSRANCEPYGISNGDCGCKDRPNIDDQWIIGNSDDISLFSKLHDDWREFGYGSPHTEFKNHLKRTGLINKVRYVHIGGGVEYGLVRDINFKSFKNIEYKGRKKIETNHLGREI